MTKYKETKSNIHVVSRCFLTNKDETILCRVIDVKWFFLPGGHVENGESGKTALMRELNEEIGENSYSSPEFIGVCESIFKLDEEHLQQGIDLVYRVETGEDFKIVENREDHIEFVSVKTNELNQHNILPASLKEALIEYAENGKVFLKDF